MPVASGTGFCFMIYYTDGYTLLKNPSPTGGGYSIVKKGGKLLHHVKIKKFNFTNNEAELLGACHSIKIAKKGDTIVVDSRNSMLWIWSGKCPARSDLTPFAKEAHDVMVQKEVYLAWMPRELNLAGHYNEQYDTGCPTLFPSTPVKKRLD